MTAPDPYGSPAPSATPAPSEGSAPESSAPGVSYIMPVLNEAPYIESAVRTILAQAYDGPQEIVLALGPSTDGTDAIVERLKAEDPRLRTVDNPAGATPIGLNLAIRASVHPVVIRVDAHSELSPDYTSAGIATLRRTGAANVGGLMSARGETPFQRAVARAYTSKVGLGGAAYHVGAEAGPVESAYLGIFDRDALLAAGLFDESLRRGQDWELNLRLRQAGREVWFDPALRVTYWPRASRGKIVRQFFATGTWRGELTRRYGAKNSLRYFAPPLLVVALALAVVRVALIGVAASWPAWLGWLTALIWLAPALYVLGILAAGLTARGLKSSERWHFVTILPLMHLSWGLGFLVGVVRGAGQSVDTSR